MQYVYDSLSRRKQIIDSRGTTTYEYDAEGNITQIDSPEGAIGYEYNSITGQRTRTYSSDTDTNFLYDELSRLAGVELVKRNGQNISEQSDYTYSEVGSRQSLGYASGNYTHYVYDALNRLTSLTNFEQFESDPQVPTGNTLSKFEYELYADGMRKSAIEQILPQGGTPGASPLKNQVVTYTYDNLNRLIMEEGDSDANGYTAEYEYDLVGNRLSRAIWFDHRADELYTEYEYNEQDRLIREIHKDTIPSAMIEHSDGPYYAYAGINSIFYGRDGSKTRIGQFKAWFMGLPSSVSHWLFGLVVVMLVVAFFVPALMQILARIRGRQPTRMPLSLSHRCLSVLIAYVMLISPAGFEQLANASVQYSELGVSTWGQADRIIEYGQWDGTGRTGNFTLGYDDNGSVIKKITWDTNGTPETGSDDTKVEKVTYEYNLRNRLARVTTVDYLSSTTTVVEYKYNDEGIRVQKIDDPDVSPTITTYLVDPYNHTGYAQPLEESTGGTLKTYTIGNDVLTQAEDSDPAEHLLYDGHGSTRQLVSGSIGSTNIIDDFSYDGYGVLLQDESAAQNNPGKTPTQATSLLYAGEYLDTDAQQYYLRARWYNPLSGLFNRIDPFSGNYSDPQSLHKYLYCHANPVNSIDPTGHEFSLEGMFITAVITGLITGLIAGVYTAIVEKSFQKGIDAFVRWFWIGFFAALIVYSIAWTIHSIWVWLKLASDPEIQTQIHHFATNKHSFWTPRFEQIVSKYNLSLDDVWNWNPLSTLYHSGPHPWEYHQWVFDQMIKSADEAGPSANRFIILFSQYVIQPVMENPEMLKPEYWRGG